MSKNNEVETKSEDEKAPAKVVKDSAEIARILGADRVEPVRRTPSKGPLEWLALREQVRQLKDESVRPEYQVEEDSAEVSPAQEA